MQQILCIVVMHAQTNIIVGSIECPCTKGLFAWVLAAQPKSGLSLDY